MRRSEFRIDLVKQARRWLTRRAQLLADVDSLRSDNAKLRTHITELQKAKAAAERKIEELRHDKDSLRAKNAELTKTTDAAKKARDQFGEKIAELRDENELLRKRKR